MGAPVDDSGLVTPAEGMVTPSGLTSGVPAGMETPDTIELRKKKIENEMEEYVSVAEEFSISKSYETNLNLKIILFFHVAAMKPQCCSKCCQRNVVIVLVHR